MADKPYTSIIEEAIKKAFNAAYGYHGIVVKFIVVAEIVDQDSNRSLTHITNPNMSLWDAIGMLEAVASDAKLSYAGLSTEVPED